MLTDEQRKGLLADADDMDACGWKDDAAGLRELLAAAPAEGRKDCIATVKTDPKNGCTTPPWTRLFVAGVEIARSDDAQEMAAMAERINRNYAASTAGAADERAALPDEVREALTHAAGGWRGAACGTRDDAEGERRSADYNRRAKVIEDWIEARAALATAPTKSEGAAYGWPWGAREPTTKILREMAYELNLVPRGEVVCVQFLDILRKQYKAAFNASHPASEPITDAAREATPLERLEEADNARDAALFRGLMAHCWDMRTHFDKKNQPKTICATFKVTTETGEAMLRQAREIVSGFVANANANIDRAGAKGGNDDA